MFGLRAKGHAMQITRQATFSKIWLDSAPKVMLYWPLVSITFYMLCLNRLPNVMLSSSSEASGSARYGWTRAKDGPLQVTRQCHFLQAMAVVIAKGDARQDTRQRHLFQAATEHCGKPCGASGILPCLTLTPLSRDGGSRTGTPDHLTFQS